MRRKLLIFFCLMLTALAASAQVDRSEVRSGNRRFKKGDFRNAAVEYMKALDKDSTSFAGNYNLASVHYRLGDFASAGESLDHLKDAAPESEYAADYYFNRGDVAIAKKDWQGAVDAFKECLLRDPGSIEAKENYIYAKKHLENNQNGGGGGEGQNDQNQDQDEDQNKDQNEDQNQDQQNQNQNQNQEQQNQQPQPQKVSPQQAQQMLQAIQAKEKKTQEKVEKAKAAVGVKKNEKNW
ncbi:MAG: tetratricopeptide repeat protein [Bacteroidales bacterium]|nr:tetratricopeptide repeat protein [Bacteroidales bacterium]